MTIEITVFGTCKLQLKKTKLITEEHLLFGQEKKNWDRFLKIIKILETAWEVVNVNDRKVCIYWKCFVLKSLYPGLARERWREPSQGKSKRINRNGLILQKCQKEGEPIHNLGTKLRGLPRWCYGKEFACQCRRCRRHGFSPWVRKKMATHSNILA